MQECWVIEGFSICVAEVDAVKQQEQDAREGRGIKPSILASPQCGTIREARQLESAAADQNNLADQIVEETAMDEDVEVLPLTCSSGNHHNFSFFFA